MEDNNRQNNRHTLEGPAFVEPKRVNRSGRKAIEQITKHKRQANFPKDEKHTPRWHRVLPLLSLILPFVSMLFPLYVGIIFASTGALLSILTLTVINIHSTRRWAATVGLVTGILLIPIYLVLISRGVTSIIIPY